MNRIITVSREFGSGGRTIARMAGERLGIPVYDSELLGKIAEKSGFTQEYVSEKAENLTFGALLSSRLSRMGTYRQESVEDYLWKMQKEVILELAAKESCIIVGRCADYILRGRADCLRVFIHADKKKRAERIVSAYRDESTDPPEKRLRDKDKRRSAFYSCHTDMVWGDPHNYQLCLDSGELGLETCAELICGLY